MSDYIARSPSYSLASELTTFNDVVDSLLDAFGMEISERNNRNTVRAVLEAYRDLPNKREWNYFKARLPFTTSPQITEGTAEYDHTGNVSGERIVTFSTGTLPNDVDLYSLLFNGIHYEIDKRISATKLQLTERSNPGADVAATTYALYKECYVLPLDFQSGGILIDVSSRYATLDYKSPDELLRTTRGYSAGQPYCYTYRALPRRQGALGLYFGPTPTTARNYEVIYNRKPRPLTTQLYSTGTATVSSGSQSVTISGAALTQRHVGCVIRLGTAADLPLPMQGGLLDGTAAGLERVVDSVESATTLTLDAAADAAYTGVKFTISSPIDVNPGPMMTYFMRACEAVFARLEGREDRKERENAAFDALRDAAAADNASAESNEPRFGPVRLGDLASSVTP